MSRVPIHLGPLLLAALAPIGCRSIANDPDRDLGAEPPAASKTAMAETAAAAQRGTLTGALPGEFVRVGGDHEAAIERDFGLRDALPGLAVRIESPKAGDLITGPLHVDVKTTDVPGDLVEITIDGQPALEGSVKSGAVTIDPERLSLSRGVHVLRAFAVRPWKESVKVASALASTYFYYGERTGAVPDARQPSVIYNQPRGEMRVTPSTNRVLADFVVTGVKMGDRDFKVRYTLDDREPVVLTTWTPLWFEALPPGNHRLRFDLVGPDAALSAAPFGAAEGTFTIVQTGSSEGTAGVL